MAETVSRPLRLANMAALVAFGWLAILLGLAPVDAQASAIPAPDLLFCVSAFLVLRRPSATPGVLVLALGLLRDLAGGGPVGLGALILWAAIEWLRARRDGLVRSRWAEALAISAFAFLMPLAELAALTIAFAPSPPLATLAAGALATIAGYGATALVFRHLLRVRGEPAENLRLIGRAAP